MVNKKEVCLRLRNVSYDDWLKLAYALNLDVTHSARGSHASIRHPSKKLNDVKGVITSLTPNGCSGATNQKIYKRFIDAGFSAEQINKILL